jgi:hypothetical protein
MAVIGGAEETREGNSFAAREGKVNKEIMDADSACNSCWEEEGTGAGATGAEGVFRAAQHGILQQPPPLRQHDFTVGVAPHAATNGQAARRNPSSKATANLVNFKAMPLSGSFLMSQPHRLSHIGATK